MFIFQENVNIYFKMKKIKINRSNLISEIITEIYDKHWYMNSFVTVAGNLRN